MNVIYTLIYQHVDFFSALLKCFHHTKSDLLNQDATAYLYIFVNTFFFFSVLLPLQIRFNVMRL